MTTPIGSTIKTPSVTAAPVPSPVARVGKDSDGDNDGSTAAPAAPPAQSTISTGTVGTTVNTTA